MPRLTPPAAGLAAPLRRLRNKSNDVAKVAVVVAAGAELEVDDDVAAQLLRQSTAFAEADSVSPPGGSGGTVVADAGPTAGSGVGPDVEEAGGGSARGRSGRRGD